MVVMVSIMAMNQRISLTTEKGWRFVTPGEDLPGQNVVPDPINDAHNIKELYLLADSNYTGRFSVPVLWDTKLKTIVSNESSEIIRMLHTKFDGLLGEESKGVNLVPDEFREKIDKLNAWIYVSQVQRSQSGDILETYNTNHEKDDVNNGV